MKKKSIYMALLTLVSVSCINENVAFKLDTDQIAAEAVGGIFKVNVSSSDNWIATTDEAWITVSPANGKASTVCEIKVDSAITNTSREGYVRIQNQSDWSNREILVTQKGFDYSIILDEPDVHVEDYAKYGERYFDVKVSANVNFKVNIPDDGKDWLANEDYDVILDRGARPRNVTLRFNWDINSRPETRLAQISFVPVDSDGNESGVALTRNDILNVEQGAAPVIEEGTRQGDSSALLAISRALNLWTEWDESEKMDNWDNVDLWETGPNRGRVRYARFYMFNIEEGLPFEVKYLTAAEELVFYSNDNKFMRDLPLGDDISTLTQLKRLTVAYYGLTSLPESFARLENLEYLNLSGNNFQRVPSIINKDNFPNLHSIVLNANYKVLIYDLYNSSSTDIGGFYDEEGFPRAFLEWGDKLDTLVLSVNYLKGSIPDMKDYPITYTEAEVEAVDTLPRLLIGTPKVLPNIKCFSINLNRFTGTIPDWLMYHPSLDLFDPFTLVFSQEGKAPNGKSAGFDNTPGNLDYYYKLDGYKNKKYAPK